MSGVARLKAQIRRVSREKGIPPQVLLQNYMMERFLEKLSASPHRDNFVLKGGFLIAAMVGIGTRSTMDIDATVTGRPLTRNAIRHILTDICSTPVSDDLVMTVETIEEIRDNDEYHGFRAHIKADLEGTRGGFKVDLTTGDSITPGAIAFSFPTIFDGRLLHIRSYNVETLLAEKIETILVRGNQNTRLRDFYDIYILTQPPMDNLDSVVAGEALTNTLVHRGTLTFLADAHERVESLRDDPTMNQRWRAYQQAYHYARGITFGDTIDAVVELLGQVA